MNKDKKFEKDQIEKVLNENFISLMPTFYEMQSIFLSGIYKRYGDLEGGNIVIFFARDLHLEILRMREADLSYNLSLDEFWKNHKKIIQSKKKIIYISQQTGLPKETARRKLIELIKKRHIKKGERNRLFWEPAFELKDSYIKIIEEEINALSKFIFEQGKFLDMGLPFSKIQRDIRDNFSFFWYHFLNFELEYIKFWQIRLKDLEMLLIGLQTQIQTLNYIRKKISGDFDAFFLNRLPKTLNIKDANISATSISEITGIPRATCIRKLDRYVKMKFLDKDKISKRYYLLLNQLNSNPQIPASEGTKRAIKIFSQFSSTVLKGLSR